MTSDAPTVSNTTITFTDIQNSFFSKVVIRTTNADGSTRTTEVQILKTIADQIKANNYTIAQAITLFQRTNGGFVIQ